MRGSWGRWTRRGGGDGDSEDSGEGHRGQSEVNIWGTQGSPHPAEISPGEDIMGPGRTG
jgi:hypothetical protein